MPADVLNGFVLGQTVNVQAVVPVRAAEDEFGVVGDGKHVWAEAHSRHEGARQPLLGPVTGIDSHETTYSTKQVHLISVKAARFQLMSQSSAVGGPGLIAQQSTAARAEGVGGGVSWPKCSRVEWRGRSTTTTCTRLQKSTAVVQPLGLKLTTTNGKIGENNQVLLSHWHIIFPSESTHS